MKRVLHLEPRAGQISASTIDGIEDIQELLKLYDPDTKKWEEEPCYFTCVTAYIDGEEYTVFVDDEGLLKTKAENRDNFFVINGYPYPLCGNAVIMGGTTEDGDTLPCEASTSFMLKNVQLFRGDVVCHHID